MHPEIQARKPDQQRQQHRRNQDIHPQRAGLDTARDQRGKREIDDRRIRGMPAWETGVREGRPMRDNVGPRSIDQRLQQFDRQGAQHRSADQEPRHRDLAHDQQSADDENHDERQRRHVAERGEVLHREPNRMRHRSRALGGRADAAQDRRVIRIGIARADL
jgi:hypothetical protein